MEVILKSNIEKLGAKDEVVKVKAGYARNYLLPRGYAIIATPSAIKMHNENLKQRSHKETKILADAQTLSEQLGNLEIKIGTKASETGKYSVLSIRSRLLNHLQKQVSTSIVKASRSAMITSRCLVHTKPVLNSTKKLQPL
jgi:ribosomal protein L9